MILKNYSILFLAIATIAFSFLCLDAYADSIFLEGGGEIKGIVVEEHRDRIVISTVDGEMTIERKDIDNIFYDMPDQNYMYLGDKELDNKNFIVVRSFYKKALELNPHSVQAKDSLYLLEDFQQRAEARLDELSEKQLFKMLSDSLGLRIVEVNGRILVAAVEPASDAQKMGIKKMDCVVSAWGRSLMFTDAKDAAIMLIGNAGTPVAVDIERTVLYKKAKPVSVLDRIFKKKMAKPGVFKMSMKLEGLTVLDTNKDIEQFGLKFNDRIVAINGISTRYMPLQVAEKTIFKSKSPMAELIIRRRLTLIRK